MDKDCGLVIYNKSLDCYYAGLNTWKKGLRFAQVYHKESYLREAIDSMVKKYNVEKDELIIKYIEIAVKDSNIKL